MPKRTLKFVTAVLIVGGFVVMLPLAVVVYNSATLYGVGVLMVILGAIIAATKVSAGKVDRCETGSGGDMGVRGSDPGAKVRNPETERGDQCPRS